MVMTIWWGINYLENVTYPSYATFVKTILSLQGCKQQNFPTKQKVARKDVEHAFVVFQARFEIMRGLAHFFYPETLKDIMTTCIICIIWSLKMSDILTLEQMTSIMIKSMIVNPNRCHIPPRVTLCSSLNVIIPLEIEEFILNFKQISSSIYGNYKASRRNLEL